jgi:F420H(2)-dependent quinone reductase
VPQAVVTRVSRLHAAILGRSGGRIKRSFVLAGGQPVLVLTTTGRRSGAQRSTALAYLEDGGRYVLFANNLGSRRDPAWCHNLRANPQARIQVKGETFAVTAHQASGDDATRLWRRYRDRIRPAETFRQIAGREIPIMVLERTQAE